MSASAGVRAGAANELRQRIAAAENELWSGGDLVLGGPKTKKSARGLIMMAYFGSSYWT